MIPIAGSAYTYCYITLGEIWAWIIGWDLILEYGLAVSAVAIGWSGYLNALLRSTGIILPPALSAPPGTDGGMVNLPAMGIVLCLYAALNPGTKKSARTNAAIVAIKIAVIILFIVLGLFSINPANWTPFMPPAGWLGVFSGAAIIFFAFTGFDAVVTAAEETKDPQKSLPLGLIGSLAICIVLYIVLGVILTGIVPFAELAGPDAINAPIAFALGRIGISWGAVIVSVGALCGMTSVILVMLFGQSRIFFAMSRDGLLPAFFSEISTKDPDPGKSDCCHRRVYGMRRRLFPSCNRCRAGQYGHARGLCDRCQSASFFSGSSGRTLSGSFSCPFVPVIPLLCVGSCAFLIFHLNFLAHLMFVLWLCIGIAFYTLYGMHKSARREGTVTCDNGMQPVTPAISHTATGTEFLVPDTPAASPKTAGLVNTVPHARG